MNLLVKDITNVILALEANVIGTRKVILIGHSVGGCIATFVVRRCTSCLRTRLKTVPQLLYIVLYSIAPPLTIAFVSLFHVL